MNSEVELWKLVWSIFGRLTRFFHTVMHPRNPYRVPPDFASLAQAYPPLQKLYVSIISLL